MASVSDFDESTRAAILLAEESPDDAAQARLRRRKRFIIGRRIVLMTVVLIIGAGLAIYFAGTLPKPPRDGVPAGQRTLGFVLLISGILLEIGYFVLIIRSGEFRAGWRSPSLVLGWRQRREIRQQIRGNRVVDPALLPISRELATRTKRSKIISLMFVALSMIFAGNALNSGRTVLIVIAVTLGALYLCLIPYIWWESRRAARFLVRYPAPPSADQG